MQYVLLNAAVFSLDDVYMCIIEHKVELEKDVTGDTAGHFERMLVVLLQVRSLLKIFLKMKIQDVN